MAEKQVFLGSVGPLLYDDANFYAFDTDGKARVQGAPTANNEVLRFQDAMLASGDQTIAGKKTFTGEVELDHTLNHDGALIGLFNATPVGQSTGWSVSNVTTDKVYDVNTVTLTELANVVGTLIDYLKTLGPLAP